MRPEMNQSKNDLSSLLKMCTSMLIFGTIGIFRRYIPLSSSSLAMIRGIAGALFLFLVASLRKRTDIPLSRKAVISFVISGCFIGFNWMFLFEAYRYTSVGIATLCYYMQPMIMILLSPIIFHEKLTWKKVICAIAAVIGMYLVSGGTSGENDLKGILYGLAAACLYAGVVIFNKKAPKADAYQKTMIQLFSAGMVLVPYILLSKGIPSFALNAMEWGLLVTVCLVHTGLAYMLYFSAMEGLKAQTIAVMGYIDPVSALFLSALILGESLTLSALCGAVLIIASALIAELSDH